MVNEEVKKEVDHIRDWFIHDSNSSIYSISSYLQAALIKPEKKDEYINLALLRCEEALYLNTLLGNRQKQSKSCKEALTAWTRYREYPKVNVSTEHDLILRGHDSTKVVMIVSELAKNAHKAEAKNMRVVFREDGIHISNDGKPLDVDVSIIKNRIFEKGYSTSGTSGLGLSICRELADWCGLEVNLIYSNPVTFLITKKTS